jgi:hypothetical protein
MTGFSINERNGALSCFRFLIYIHPGVLTSEGGIGQEEETVCGQWAQQWCDYRLTHHPYAFASLFGHSCEPFLISICCVYTSVLYPVWNETEHTHAQPKKKLHTFCVPHTHTHTYANSFVCYFILSATSSQGKKITSTHLLYVENVLVWICPRIFRSIPQHCAEVADEMPQKSVKFLWFQPFLCGQSGKRKK